MRSPSVLLVDDDPMMRDVLTALFETNGGFHIAGVAADGDQAISLAGETQPDVVVLDYLMPRCHGGEAAAGIRVSSPRSKIVAFSAVLTEPPAWADTYVFKNHIDALVPLVELLCGEAA